MSFKGVKSFSGIWIQGKLRNFYKNTLMANAAPRNNPAKEQFITFQDVVVRAAREISLQMPKDFANDAVHCYMHYVNAYSNAVSTSVYVGEIVVV
nr:DUF6266 family protein [Pedobacter panaciterrae]